MMDDQLFYLKRTLRFSFASVLFIVFSCRIQIAPIATIIGLAIGWRSIEQIYILRKGKMNLLSDLQYFLTLVALMVFAFQIVPFTCNIMNTFQACSQQAKTVCAFLFSFSIGIASFSLWLWYRLKGNIILSAN